MKEPERRIAWMSLITGLKGHGAWHAVGMQWYDGVIGALDKESPDLKHWIEVRAEDGTITPVRGIPPHIPAIRYEVPHG